MSKKQNSIPVVYDFKYGEKHEYHVFPAIDIEYAAAERQGIYAWYMRVLADESPGYSATSFCNVMSSKIYEIDLKGNLQDRFNGKASKQPHDIAEKQLNSKLLNNITTVFCPPLYIGISKNIKQRLKSHRDALVSFLDQNIDNMPNNHEQTNVIDDTEAESNKFGERIGKVLKAEGCTNENSLFLKVIYFDSLSREDLINSESFVNRNFHPLFGLR